MRSFYIVCLKYAPGMWQHMQDFVNQLLGRGYLAQFLIAAEYRWMNKSYGTITHYTQDNLENSKLSKLLSYFWLNWANLKRVLRKNPPSALLLVSWHPLNFVFGFFVKSLYPDSTIISWMHEPYKDNKRIYGFKAIIIYIIEFLQKLSLRFTDVAIMHSIRGLRMFNKRYPHFKGVKTFSPLLFHDDGYSATTKRRYISFLGRAEKAKGIDAFFALVAESARKNLNWEYQIVTSSNIKNYLQALPAAAHKKLRVINAARISDDDIRQAAANSLAILTLYRETMQSGVIPLALMKGTPVIGTDIEGITEWIRDNEAGVIVPVDPTMEQLYNALAYIQDHFEEISPRCRDLYLSTFDDRNWFHHYGWLAQVLQICAPGETALL